MENDREAAGAGAIDCTCKLAQHRREHAAGRAIKRDGSAFFKQKEEGEKNVELTHSLTHSPPMRAVPEARKKAR